jgi:hypothetical protein
MEEKEREEKTKALTRYLKVVSVDGFDYFSAPAAGAVAVEPTSSLIRFESSSVLYSIPTRTRLAEIGFSPESGIEQEARGFCSHPPGGSKGKIVVSSSGVTFASSIGPFRLQRVWSQRDFPCPTWVVFESHRSPTLGAVYSMLAKSSAQTNDDDATPPGIY